VKTSAPMGGRVAGFWTGDGGVRNLRGKICVFQGLNQHAFCVRPFPKPTPCKRKQAFLNLDFNFKNTSWKSFSWLLAALALALISPARAGTSPPAIPFPDLGARPPADYCGEALDVTLASDGPRLRCGLQKLEGHATSAGLCLESTVPGAGDKLRLIATTLSRPSTVNSPWSTTLSATGTVSVHDKLVRFTRPGLSEEYSLSGDGVRQDFIIAARPTGVGDLRLELELSGARAEASVCGAVLTLDQTRRVLAYHRLRVADATGRELTARLEVLSTNRLAIMVTDANAAYPVRIDPTFGDADWVNLGLGMNLYVFALAKSETDLYAGGAFTAAGGVPASYIARCNGSTWSPLGSGMNPQGVVYALGVSGTDLYAGGCFTAAGGIPATNIAKWNGSAWSALGSGMGPYSPYATSTTYVQALAVSGTNLYAGGYFTTAGGVPANNIAQWNGGAWSALASGTTGSYPNWPFAFVDALAVCGTNLYAGGSFNTAGGLSASCIAKWDGSAWSALGSGMSGSNNPCVYTLAVIGTNLYAGGSFTMAGGVAANYIAKWNGLAWSSLGSGMNAAVMALAASGTNLYAGGAFTMAGGLPANYVAKWDGQAWSSLGSGLDESVIALAADGAGHLFAGGDFARAGNKLSSYIALADVGSTSTNPLPAPSQKVTSCTEAALRSAMAVGGTVTFACSGTITVANPVVIGTNTVLDGSGQSVTISGDFSQVFDIDTNVSATLVNLTIANGWSENGGGIYNAGTLNVTNCIFVANTVQGAPGNGLSSPVSTAQAGWGGAVYNSGELNMVGCSFISNSVCGGQGDSTASAASGGGDGGGGAVYNSGSLHLVNCSFEWNSASGGQGAMQFPAGGAGGESEGGALCNLGTLIIERSLFASNTAVGGAGANGQNGSYFIIGQGLPDFAGAGGAGGGGGGAALFVGGPSSLVNCTLAGNQACGGLGGTGGNGGVGFNGGTGQYTYYPGADGGSGGSACGAICAAPEALALTNCTIATNSGVGASGGVGGNGNPAGLSGSNGVSAGALLMTNGVLVNCLLDANSPTNLIGSIADAGHNLSSDASCAFTNIGSFISPDPKLGPLADNGGPTLTMALLPGSPAIDAGDTSLAPATDQRGFPRPAGVASDIGAFEYGSVIPTIAVTRAGPSGLNILAMGNAGRSCRLLSSTDLSSWIPLATNYIGSDGTIMFHDNLAPGSACRFYLLVMP
jgi:hypothetical protein